MDLTLSDEFQPFHDEIMASCKPSVAFTLSCASTQLWQSKVGGQPYFPLNIVYPRNANDEPLFFVAQINFAEMPMLPDFPRKGILQFYIDAKDDCYGAYDDGYKIIYHADVLDDISKLYQEFDFFKFNEDDCGLPFPKDDSYKIHFQDIESQAITRLDFRFNEIASKLSAFLYRKTVDDQYDRMLWERYDDVSARERHRIGGYPACIDDEREGNDELRDYILLFQLVTDYDFYNDGEKPKMMWEDCGVSNFFIHPNDLKNLEFDRVVFSTSGA